MHVLGGTPGCKCDAQTPQPACCVEGLDLMALHFFLPLHILEFNAKEFFLYVFF